jgi:hypothetical protein
LSSKTTNKRQPVTLFYDRKSIHTRRALDLNLRPLRSIHSSNPKEIFMFRNLLRNPITLAAFVSFIGLTALSSPSLAFNPQPDPPGRTSLYATPGERLLALQKTNKTLIFAGKPDCKSRNGKGNPCS